LPDVTSRPSDRLHAGDLRRCILWGVADPPEFTAHSTPGEIL